MKRYYENKSVIKHQTEQNYFDKRKKMWSVDSTLEIRFFREGFFNKPVQKRINLLFYANTQCRLHIQHIISIVIIIIIIIMNVNFCTVVIYIFNLLKNMALYY